MKVWISKDYQTHGIYQVEGKQSRHMNSVFEAFKTGTFYQGEWHLDEGTACMQNT
jgi:hypothetical protein